MWQTTLRLLVCYMLTNYSQIYSQIYYLYYYTFPAIVFKVAFEKIFLLFIFSSASTEMQQLSSSH